MIYRDNCISKMNQMPLDAHRQALDAHQHTTGLKNPPRLREQAVLQNEGAHMMHHHNGNHSVKCAVWEWQLYRAPRNNRHVRSCEATTYLSGLRPVLFEHRQCGHLMAQRIRRVTSAWTELQGRFAKRLIFKHPRHNILGELPSPSGGPAV